MVGTVSGSLHSYQVLDVVRRLSRDFESPEFNIDSPDFYSTIKSPERW